MADTLATAFVYAALGFGVLACIFSVFAVLSERNKR